MRAQSSRRFFTIQILAVLSLAGGTAAALPAAEGAGSLDALSVRGTILTQGTGAQVELVIEVDVTAGGPEGPGTLVADLGGRKVERAIGRIPAGRSVHEVGVPVPSAAAPASFTLRARGVERTATAVIAPPRIWTVHLVHFSHTDIGYTDRQENVIREHARFIGQVLDLCTETDGFPEDSKFRWTCETAWQVENYLEKASPAERDGFLRRVKEGRIEVTALYLNLLTGLCSTEELCRSVYAAGRLRKDLGIPIESAMSSDVTGYTWALPAVFASAGIRYFSTAINIERAKRPNPPVERLFRWESPSGVPVVVFLSRDQYQEGNTVGFIEDVEKVRQKLPPYLEAAAKEGYAHEAILLRTPGRIGDNTPPEVKISRIAREWNGRYSNPRVLVSTNGAFFREAAARPKELPAWRKEWTDWWADGAGSSARETALVRVAQDRIASAEMLSTALLASDPSWVYPRDGIAAVYKDILFYDEHTWGAAESISKSDSPMTRDQWAWKAAYAVRAFEGAGALYRKALGAVAARSRKEGLGLLVNPLPWERDAAPEGFGRAPSLGVAWFRGEAKGLPEVQVGEESIESPFFRVRLNGRHNAISSILDKRIGRELLDAESPFGAAEYLYVKGNDRTHPLRCGEGRVIERSSTGGRGALVFEARGEKARKVVTTVILYSDLKRLDLEVRIDKEGTLEKEGIYIAFPFAPAGARLRCELSGAAFSPEVDQLPKAARDWIAIHRWVSVNGPGVGIAWSSPDAPLVELGAIHTNEFLDRLEIPRPLVLSYVMNNHWMTNYKASQEGELVFRYAIASQVEMSDHDAARMAREHAMPLWREAPGGTLGELVGSESWISLKDKFSHCLISAFKPAEDGDGFVVRILDFGTEVREGILQAAWPIRTAQYADILEEPRAALTASQSAVRVPLRGPGIVTVRLRFGK